MADYNPTRKRRYAVGESFSCHKCGAAVVMTERSWRMRLYSCAPCEREGQRRRYHADAERHRQRTRGYRAGRATYTPTRDPAMLEKRRARDSVRKAIKSGRLQRQPCERCGAATVQAHHDDYGRRLDVRWLCALCHGVEHRGTPRGKKREQR